MMNREEVMKALHEPTSAREVLANRVELEAFRELVEVEEKLVDWPGAVPLLEKAYDLYALTHQAVKQEAIRQVLVKVAPENPRTKDSLLLAAVRVEEAEGKSPREAERVRLEESRQQAQETGRLALPLLQRRLGLSYNKAAYLADMLAFQVDQE